MVLTYLFIYFFVTFQLNSNIVSSQRTFANPAVSDPAPCACDLHIGACDPNCCCDPDCSNSDLTVSPVCNSTRTISSYYSTSEQQLQTWNCSNSTSASLYDYFPFVCVQLKLNEVLGEFYATDNVTFIKTNENATNLRSTFVAEYPELFQPTTLSTTIAAARTYSIGAPVQLASGGFLTLPGNLAGSLCQSAVNVLFGVNRDVSCSTITPAALCTLIGSTTSILKGDGSSSAVSISFYSATYTSSTPTTITSTDIYFQNNYNLDITSIPFTSGSINDYCPNRHPLNRTQRYLSVCTTSDISRCNSQYQIWNGCPLRDNFKYSTISDNFFTARSTVIDDSVNFADFSSATSASGCTGNSIRRAFYRFSYSSIDNTISAVEVFYLIDTSVSTSFPPRITIQWNAIADNPAVNATIPRGYADGETLQFRRNGAVSDVSNLVPTSTGYCVDATRTTLRYKQSTSSSCFIQLTQSTMQQCHNLNLNMYLYLNVFYAPASHVLAYPNSNATLIPIRDDTQDSKDLDQIDVTRPNNRLDTSYIIQTTLNQSLPTIYDIAPTVPVCYNVPSGIYIQFGYVRVPVSPTVSFERIVSVRYNYTYSNWQFDCNQPTCTSTSTQKYLVTFQSEFIDYTNTLLNFTDVTRSDITSADNYIEHLLWLITPEYKGEPGYRNYTIAMILIFIAISVVVIHVLLFGIMYPF